MDITKFKCQSQITEIKLDSEDIVKQYGEAISFWTHTHPPLTAYFRFFESRVNGDYATLEQILRELILNSKGEPVLSKDETLPADIFTNIILKLGEILGKLPSKTSIHKPGEAQK